ncbi:MAG: DUF4358 domain-containing protein [Faecalicoccus sp.]|uniref:DUF4358 domain-containing protein n=1 Tax=unclassified Faecalicoccus TaxID=2643311 RepID=UPI0025FE3916|nr:DUF4358 domain-containing protein [Faecalicoccus sp.]MCI6379282.1 DUF4358 domain-containing protein [Erysipelotrichaceae bacterium]MDY4869109.1 DUF4358 domain-containing protein [Faecalicoccus sp.]
MKYGLWAAKGVVFLLLIILMLNVFSGPKMSKEDFGVVLSKVQENLDLSTLLQQDNQAIRKNLGLDPEAYERIVYFKIDDVMQANEYVLVQFKDTDQKNAFQQAIESRIAEQTNLYDGYAPDQVQLLKQAVVDIQANYALYVVDTNAKTMDEQFLESL